MSFSTILIIIVVIIGIVFMSKLRGTTGSGLNNHNISRNHHVRHNRSPRRSSNSRGGHNSRRK